MTRDLDISSVGQRAASGAPAVARDRDHSAPPPRAVRDAPPPGGTFDTLIKEDGAIEDLGALGLLATSILFLLSFRAARRAAAPRLLRWVLLALALVFLFGAGEEISWGQRIVGLETPTSLAEVNKQEELNLHNLSGPVSMETLFQLFWLALTVLVPGVALLSTRARRLLERALPIVPLAVGLLLIWTQLLHELFLAALDGSDRYESRYPLDHSAFEIKESAISVILAIGALTVYRSLRRARGEVPSRSARGTPEPMAAG